MRPWLSGRFGNPSGSHSVARAARQAVDEARDKVAGILGTAPGDVVFTASGTEAANLAILGRLRAVPGPVVVSAIEHHAVLHAARAAERALGTPYGWWQWATTGWSTWAAWRRRLTRPSASCRSSWSTAK